MRYLITGGAGFIGSHLVDALVARGEAVVVLDDFSTGSRENLAAALDRIELIEGSITDPATCAHAVDGVDFVLHQAALPSVQRSVENPARSHDICATGTLNVLIAARDAGVRRVVYAASSSAYGDTVELPKRETMVPDPRSPYAAAKLAGEQYCRAFHRSFGLETIILRYFNVFGPRQDPLSPYGAVIPKFIEAALSGVPPIIHGDGGQTRDFTYVANVVEANLIACGAGPDAVGRTFNIGYGSRVSMVELWTLIRELTGTSVVPEYTLPRAGDVRDSLAALDEAKAFLNFDPAIDLNSGLEATVQSARARRPTPSAS